MAGTFGATSPTTEAFAGMLVDRTAPQAPPRSGLGRAGHRRRTGKWRLLAGVTMLVTAGGAAFALQHGGGGTRAQAAPPPPIVTVSSPLREDLTPHEGFLGQFSAVADVDLRAQVGGVLTEIHFTDGQIVQGRSAVCDRSAAL